ANRYGANFANSPVDTAKPIVTAGFRCASLLPKAIAVNTPAMTAKAQPLAITIQPAPSAFERLSNTFATTPSPRNMSTSVPMNSPKHFASIWPPFPKSSPTQFTQSNDLPIARFQRLYNSSRFPLVRFGFQVRSADQFARRSFRSLKYPTARPAAYAAPRAVVASFVIGRTTGLSRMSA